MKQSSGTLIILFIVVAVKVVLLFSLWVCYWQHGVLGNATLTNLLPFPTLGLGSFSTLGLRFPSTWIFKCSSFFFQRWLEAFQLHALSASISHLLFSAEGRVSPTSMAQTTWDAYLSSPSRGIAPWTLPWTPALTKALSCLIGAMVLRCSKLTS